MMLYPPTFIHLYSPEFSEKSEKFNLEEIGKYVKDMFPKMKVDLRGGIHKISSFPAFFPLHRGKNFRDGREHGRY